MSPFKSDNPKNRWAVYNSHVYTITEADEAVEVVKQLFRDALAGGAAKLDIGKSAAKNGRLIAIWKVDQMEKDPTIWQQMLDELGSYPYHASSKNVAAVKRAAENYFGILLAQAQAEEESYLEEKIQEIWVRQYLGISRRSAEEYVIRFIPDVIGMIRQEIEAHLGVLEEIAYSGMDSVQLENFEAEPFIINLMAKVREGRSSLLETIDKSQVPSQEMRVKKFISVNRTGDTGHLIRYIPLS